MILRIVAITGVVLAAAAADPKNWSKDAYPIRVPMLEQAPRIDGDLSDWRNRAFHDGVWDIHRVLSTPWFDPARNRLTDHGSEPSPADDLRARYYIAWDSRYLYLGADVVDNVNDVQESKHEPKRWYYKDAICWFIEAPADGKSESFGEGDHAFCFVADARKPDYGAWWRHGDAHRTYIEEPLPKAAVDYAIRRGRNGDFVLEARVDMAATFQAGDKSWRAPRPGDRYGIEIVHTDPDGGEYGGHLLIYGTGDDDATWGVMEFTGPAQPVDRKPK